MFYNYYTYDWFLKLKVYIIWRLVISPDIIWLYFPIRNASLFSFVRERTDAEQEHLFSIGFKKTNMLNTRVMSIKGTNLLLVWRTAYAQTDVRT